MVGRVVSCCVLLRSRSLSLCRFGYLVRNVRRRAYWFQAAKLIAVFAIVLELVVVRSAGVKLIVGVVILAVNVVFVGLLWPYKTSLA